jgi:hypothetical protein
MSIKKHPKYEQAKALLSEGKHSTRFIAKKLGVNRLDVSAMSRTVGMKGNR